MLVSFVFFKFSLIERSSRRFRSTHIFVLWRTSPRIRYTPFPQLWRSRLYLRPASWRRSRSSWIFSWRWLSSPLWSRSRSRYFLSFFRLLIFRSLSFKFFLEPSNSRLATSFSLFHVSSFWTCFTFFRLNNSHMSVLSLLIGWVESDSISSILLLLEF